MQMLSRPSHDRRRVPTPRAHVSDAPSRPRCPRSVPLLVPQDPPPSDPRTAEKSMSVPSGSFPHRGSPHGQLPRTPPVLHTHACRAHICTPPVGSLILHSEVSRAPSAQRAGPPAQLHGTVTHWVARTGTWCLLDPALLTPIFRQPLSLVLLRCFVSSPVLFPPQSPLSDCHDPVLFSPPASLPCQPEQLFQTSV